MAIGSVGVGQAAVDAYVDRASPAMKGEAVAMAAQVMVARKAMDAQGEIALELVRSALPGVGGKLDTLG